MMEILTILIIPLILIYFYFKIIKKLAFSFSAKYIYWIFPLSLTVNTFLLCLLTCDFYLSVHGKYYTSFKYIWQILYWVNFTFGFLVFPLIFERERNFDGSSNIRLLFRFYLRRLIIILSITIPILGVVFLILRLKLKELLTWHSVYMFPVLIVTVWGCILILLHLSLAFINIPKALIRMLLPNRKLGRS